LLIRLKHCSIGWTNDGCVTLFGDGTQADSIPHPHDHHYYVIAHRCGYGDDILAYCRQHDFCHAFVEEWLFDRPSLVLWGLAHRKPLSGKSAAYEECMAQAFQAYLRGNQEPIIGGVDWFGMKRAALRLLALRIEPRP
jgi:hypothetical protein